MKLNFLAVALVLVGATVGCKCAIASTIEVDSASGDVDALSCTLIDAFEAVAYRIPRGTCPAGTGDDVIILPANATIDVNHSYDGAVAGLPAVSSDLLLVGNGSTITATLGGPLIFVSPTGLLSLNGVTFQGIQSFDGQNAGAISVQGTLSITNCIFVENQSRFFGGAIYSEFGIVNIDDSVFLDNSAGFSGGAIYSVAGLLSVRSSYFSGNNSDDGAAIASDQLYVLNSTFRENVGYYGTINVTAFGSGSVSYSTFEGNVGAAVALNGNSLLLANNLFSHPIGGYPAQNCFDFHIPGAPGVATIEKNLSDDFSCPGATVVAERNAFDFGDPFAFRGANSVLPLRQGSAATGPTSCVDATGAIVAADQRGVRRSGGCSLGAFEYDAATYPFSTPSPLQPSDILISDGSSIYELTRAGQRVRTFYPSPNVGIGHVSGIEPIGLTTVGMFVPDERAHLQVYGVTTDTWADFTTAGWYSLNGLSDGKITHVGRRWFLSGYHASDVGENYIVAFDENGFQGSANTCAPIDALEASHDAFLYVICDSTIEIYDPQTLLRTRTIDTSQLAPGKSTSAGAVSRSGDIFLSQTDGRIYRLDQDGNMLASSNCFNEDIGCGEVTELAVADDGFLFAGSWESPSTIIMIDSEFTAAAAIPTGLNQGISAVWIAPLVGDAIFSSHFE